MLRFSANLGFLWPQLDLPDRVRAARQAGFDGVEIHWPGSTSSADLAEVLEQTGLDLLCMNTSAGNLENGEFGLAAVLGSESRARADIDLTVTYAQRVGARYVHVMAGIADSHSGSAHAAFIANLRYAASRAKDCNIDIVIEPINGVDRPGYFMQTIDQALATIESVVQDGQNNIGLMFDCYHVTKGGADAFTELERAYSRIKHFQVASVPDRREPGSGEVDDFHLFDRLAFLGYRGFVGAEYIPQRDTALSLSWLEQYRAGRRSADPDLNS